MNTKRIILVAIIFLVMAMSPALAMPYDIGGLDHYTTATYTYVSSDAGWLNAYGYEQDGDTVMLGSNQESVPGTTYGLGTLAPGDSLRVVDVVTQPLSRYVVDTPAWSETVVDGYKYYYWVCGFKSWVKSTSPLRFTLDEDKAKLFSTEQDFAGAKEKVVSHTVCHPEVGHTEYYTVDHVWTSDSSNALVVRDGQTYTVGFEDQPGLGDRDFNDMNIQVVLANVTGDLHVRANSGGATNLPWTLGNLSVTVRDPTGKTVVYPLVADAFTASVDVDLGEVYGEYTATVTDSWRGISRTATFVYQGLDTTMDVTLDLFAFNVRYFYANQYKDLGKHNLVVLQDYEGTQVVAIMFGTHAGAADWREGESLMGKPTGTYTNAQPNQWIHN